jgi:high-affinity Fe2+/Pb2+ permease
MTQNKVSTFWQCALSLFIPTGLWAFGRINKLRKGILIYVITALMALGGYVGQAFFAYNIENRINEETVRTPLFFILVILGLFAFLLPVFFMFKWSEDWNEKIEKAT